jgi:CRP-like cAMP-binding protein
MECGTIALEAPAAGDLLTDTFIFEPIFKRWKRRVTLSDEDKRATAALPWQRRAYGRDSYLAREGEPTTVCTLLITGLAFRQKLLSDGARQIISFQIPGEFLDLQNTLLDTADHNVQCLTRCTVAAVPRDALLGLMNDRPNLRRAIWMDSLVDAAVFREWVVNLGRRDAREKIAHLLCELAARMRASNGSRENVFDFPITQEQIADATGQTAVHTNRTLQGLRKDGLISLTMSKLTILDWDALAEIGDFNERYLHHSV